jgi:hypothetical protein
MDWGYDFAGARENTYRILVCKGKPINQLNLLRFHQKANKSAS